MNLPPTDPSLLIAGLLAAVAALGLASLLRRRATIGRGILLAHDFLERLHAYVASKGDDLDAYVWLTRNAPAMQYQVGAQGYMDVRSPFQNYIVENMPIVLNFLPMIRREFEFFRFRDSPSINEYTRTLQESIIRYLGTADDRHKTLTGQLFNPVIWLREGTQQIMSIPGPGVTVDWSHKYSDSKPHNLQCLVSRRCRSSRVDGFCRFSYDHHSRMAGIQGTNIADDREITAASGRRKSKVRKRRPSIEAA